jgi:hypothetical protein
VQDTTSENMCCLHYRLAINWYELPLKTYSARKRLQDFVASSDDRITLVFLACYILIKFSMLVWRCYLPPSLNLKCLQPTLLSNNKTTLKLLIKTTTINMKIQAKSSLLTEMMWQLATLKWRWWSAVLQNKHPRVTHYRFIFWTTTTYLTDLISIMGLRQSCRHEQILMNKFLNYFILKKQE